MCVDKTPLTIISTDISKKVNKHKGKKIPIW